MAHPQKDSKNRPTHFEPPETYKSYNRELPKMAHYPVHNQNPFPVERLVGFPHDQRDAWPSYDHVMPHAALPHGEYWSKYSQPIAYPPYPPRPSLKSSSEVSYVASPAQGKSRRKHKGDAAHSLEVDVWGVTPEKRKPAKSEHRRVLRGTYSDPGVRVSASARGRTTHMDDSTRPIIPSVKEVEDESGQQISQLDKHSVPIPPRAPRIPRLPTPDFSDDEESHVFCPCCNANGGHEKGCEQEGEDTQSKMKRQLHDAKAYIARKNSRAR